MDTIAAVEHAERNERMWDEQSDTYQDRHGPQLESSGGTAWGLWQVPEDDLRVLSGADREWARRWPMEHIWRVRKAA